MYLYRYGQMLNCPEGLVAEPGRVSSSAEHSVQSSHHETSLDIRSLTHFLENNTPAKIICGYTLKLFKENG